MLTVHAPQQSTTWHPLPPPLVTVWDSFLAGPNYDVTLSDTLTQVQTAKVRNATDTRVLNYYVTLSHGSNLFALPCHIHCSSGKQRQGQGTVGWARLSKFNPAASGIILQ